MTERFKELYAEAVMSVHEAFIDRMLVPSAIDLEFAELIVKECIDYCGENLSKTVGGALKIHFGVVE